MTKPFAFRAWTSAIAVSASLLSGTTLADTTRALPEPLRDADFLYDGAPGDGLVSLGNLLFFDPILSGNGNIACGTCHDPAMGSGDGLSLGIGEGGAGEGGERTVQDPVTGRVPRNAQPLYNIGARAYVSMFHDGRVERDPDGPWPFGFRSPARERLTDKLDNPLEVQALFPVTSAIEMAGQRYENQIATAAAEHRLGDAWQAIADRVDAIPAYRKGFRAVFPELNDDEALGYRHIAKALAAFQTVAFRSDESPFDAVLASGDTSSLPSAAERGLGLFYGKAGCGECHSGPLLTDHQFHAIAMPQIGPGKGHGRDMGYWEATGFRNRLEDEGRFNVTQDPKDRFAFRTPSLRNVALTGPWGHAGGYVTLEAAIRHHLDPVEALGQFDVSQVELPSLSEVLEGRAPNARQQFQLVAVSRRDDFDLRDAYVQSSAELRDRIAAASALTPKVLADDEVSDIIAFLESLTDPTAVDRSHLIPLSVPSGLPVQPSHKAGAVQNGEGG